MTYRPVSITNDCGNGYATAVVQDDEGHSVDVIVDTNPSDSTSGDRIIVDDHRSVLVDENFMTAYRALLGRQGHPATPDHLYACSHATRVAQAGARSTPSHVQSLPSEPREDSLGRISWMSARFVGVLFGTVFSYSLDRQRHALQALPPERRELGGTLDIMHIGLDGLATASYMLLEPNVPEGWATAFDLTYGGVSVIWGCIPAIGSEGQGYQRNLCVSAGANIISARGYRHGPQIISALRGHQQIEESDLRYGHLLGMGIESAVGLALLISAFTVSSRPETDPRSTGPRGINDPPLPTAGQLTARGDLLWLAGIHGVNAVGHLIYEWASGGSSGRHEIPLSVQPVGHAGSINGASLNLRLVF